MADDACARNFRCPPEVSRRCRRRPLSSASQVPMATPISSHDSNGHRSCSLPVKGHQLTPHQPQFARPYLCLTYHNWIYFMAWWLCFSQLWDTQIESRQRWGLARDVLSFSARIKPLGWPNFAPTSVLSSRRWANVVPTSFAVWGLFKLTCYQS